MFQNDPYPSVFQNDPYPVFQNDPGPQGWHDSPPIFECLTTDTTFPTGSSRNLRGICVLLFRPLSSILSLLLLL